VATIFILLSRHKVRNHGSIHLRVAVTLLALFAAATNCFEKNAQSSFPRFPFQLGDSSCPVRFS